MSLYTFRRLSLSSLLEVTELRILQNGTELFCAQRRCNSSGRLISMLKINTGTPSSQFAAAIWSIRDVFPSPVLPPRIQNSLARMPVVAESKQDNPVVSPGKLCPQSESFCHAG